MFWDIFLIQVKFSCRRDKKIFLSEFIFLILSNIFLIWEQISQIKKTFLNKFWGICSAKAENTWEPARDRISIKIKFLTSYGLIQTGVVFFYQQALFDEAMFVVKTSPD